MNVLRDRPRRPLLFHLLDFCCPRSLALIARATVVDVAVRGAVDPFRDEMRVSAKLLFPRLLVCVACHISTVTAKMSGVKPLLLVAIQPR